MSDRCELPSGWTNTTLGEVLPLQYGKGLPAAQRDEEGTVPVYGSNGVVGYHSAPLTSRPCLLVGRKGAVGAVHFAQEPCWPIDTVYFVEDTEYVEMRFCANLLGHLRLDRLDRSTAVPSLSRDDYSTVEFGLPPLNEQRRIADKLDELLSQLDAGVAALERVQANLKRYRAAVLKAAVEGKLTAQWRAEHPEVEPASVLLERILADRRRHWEAEQLAKFEAQGKRPPKGWQAKYKEPEPPDTTDLPELPEGWCWASVEQVIRDSLTNGISRKGTPTPPGVAVLRLSAMSEEGFDYADRQYIDIDANAAERLRICRGDFFISRGNGALRLVGRGTLAQDPEEPIVFPDLMIRVRFCGSPVLRSYVSRVWPSIHLRRQIETAAKTTAGIYKINQQDIARLVLPLPPEAEQHELTAAIESRFSIADHVAEQVAQDASRAARLRQSILKQAFEGKLVPQDPNDEPAEVLLERIAAERGQARPKAPWRGRMG